MFFLLWKSLFSIISRVKMVVVDCPLTTTFNFLFFSLSFHLLQECTKWTSELRTWDERNFSAICPKEQFFLYFSAIKNSCLFFFFAESFFGYMGRFFFFPRIDSGNHFFSIIFNNFFFTSNTFLRLHSTPPRQSRGSVPFRLRKVFDVKKSG